MAKPFANDRGLIRCPCNRCVNNEKHQLDVLEMHIFWYGFMAEYDVWIYYGEKCECYNKFECAGPEWRDIRKGLDIWCARWYFWFVISSPICFDDFYNWLENIVHFYSMWKLLLQFQKLLFMILYLINILDELTFTYLAIAWVSNLFYELK